MANEIIKYVYVLQVTKETEDEVCSVIDSVFTTEAKAESFGKMLEETEGNGILGYYVSRHLIYQ